MLFKDRIDAGARLADNLSEYRSQNPLVLALPRGGVPVGFQIAKALHLRLDVLVVRKLGSPGNPEFGIGAIAQEGIEILDKDAISYLGISNVEIEKVEDTERKELTRRVEKYRGNSSFPKLEDETVILVDDGIATGVTMMAAIMAVLHEAPIKLIVAVPVCSRKTMITVRAIIRPFDEIVSLLTPDEFSTVGEWYKSFPQVTDEEVIQMLHQAKKFT